MIQCRKSQLFFTNLFFQFFTQMSETETVLQTEDNLIKTFAQDVIAVTTTALKAPIDLLMYGKQILERGQNVLAITNKKEKNVYGKAKQYATAAFKRHSGWVKSWAFIGQMLGVGLFLWFFILIVFMGASGLILGKGLLYYAMTATLGGIIAICVLGGAGNETNDTGADSDEKVYTVVNGLWCFGGMVVCVFGVIFLVLYFSQCLSVMGDFAAIDAGTFFWPTAYNSTNLGWGSQPLLGIYPTRSYFIITTWLAFVMIFPTFILALILLYVGLKAKTINSFLALIKISGVKDEFMKTGSTLEEANIKGNEVAQTALGNRKFDIDHDFVTKSSHMSHFKKYLGDKEHDNIKKFHVDQIRMRKANKPKSKNTKKRVTKY